MAEAAAAQRASLYHSNLCKCLSKKSPVAGKEEQERQRAPVTCMPRWTSLSKSRPRQNTAETLQGEVCEQQAPE